MKTDKLVRYLSYTAALIFVLVPFQALLTTWAGSNFGHIDLFRIWKELLMIPLTLGSLWVVYRDKQLKVWFVHSPLVALVIGFALLQLALAFMALILNKVNNSAVIYGLLINLRYLVFCLVCLVLAVRSEWLARNWRSFIMWPAAIVIAFGLLQHFILPNDWLRHFGYGPKTIPAYQAVDRKPDFVRTQSTLRGANPLGAYLVVIISILVAFWLKHKQKLSVSAAILAGLIVMYFSYSRSAWLGLVVSGLLLVYWLVNDSNFKRWFVPGVLISALVFIVALAAWHKNSLVSNTLFHTSQSSQSLESSNAVRTEAMLDGAKSIIKHPLGDGPGTAGPASFRNNHPARIAENYFIQVGQEVGIVGLVLFITINIYIAKLLWDNRRHELSLIVLAIFAGLTLVNLLSHAWADDTLAYIFWGLAGITLASSGILNKERKHAKTKEKAAKRTNSHR